ncbi:MAG TPA: peptidoglycan DD-metalloendopeptidase family protein [Candidatus Kryptonia bacterium]
MLRKLFSISVLLLTAFSLAAFPQEKQKVTKKKQELQKLQGNIKLYQQKIAESSQKETVSLSALDKLEKQNFQTRQSIKKTSDRIAANSRSISIVEQKIKDAGGKLSDLTNEYARFARSFYEEGRLHDLELVMTASSVNEMLIRYEYMKKFSDQTKSDMDAIVLERSRLSDLKSDLRGQLSKQQDYLGQKNREEAELSSSIVQQQNLISKLRKNKKVYAEQLTRSQTAAAELEKTIQQLIAEEAKREEARKKEAARIAAENESARIVTPPLPATLPAGKGRLPWPVDRGKVVARFGEQENPVLKTVTLNYGIDISVPENASAKSVADGEVSRIFWLPSYGNLIIVDNYNGLRTVYSHLSDIFVKEGDKVKAGQTLGTIGESLGGYVLHFEVWVDKDKQDPESWLSKK